MSEEPTGRLDDSGSFESRVLEQLAALREGVNSLGSRLSGVEVRLSALEEKVDARLRETRPIWENVLSKVETIDSKLNVLGLDLLETRADVERLKKSMPPAA